MKTQPRTINKTPDTGDLIRYSAPGKIIVCGEHAVVYGYPAIISSIDQFFTWSVSGNEVNTFQSIKQTLEKQKTALSQLDNLDDVVKQVLSLFPGQIKIHSDIPSGSGLGSSAALSVSLAKLLLPVQSSIEEIRELAMQFERMQHGNPSGGDVTASCYGGLIWYQKNLNDNTWEYEPLAETNSDKQQVKFPQFWLLDSGEPKESTKMMVEMVADLRGKNKKKVDAAFEQMEEVALGWKKIFSSKATSSKSLQEKIRNLLTKNQQALEEINICSNRALTLIKDLKNIGAAAKVTGAGGVEDGSGMILFTHPNKEKVQNWAKENAHTLIPISFNTINTTTKQ